MRSLVRALAAAAAMLAGCLAAEPSPAAQAPAAVPATPDPVALGREWNAERAARESWSRAGDDLRAGITSGEADPGQEASRAAAIGRWSLVTSYSSIPRGVPYALGMECRPNRYLFVYGRLSLLAPHLRHSVPNPEVMQEELERERRNYDRFRRFALSYNRLLAAHPDFPFRDLCRLAADDYRPSSEEYYAPVRLGFDDLQETDSPVDLYEAARRGSLASLGRLIAAQPRRLHIPDVLDMTPLAWAVVHDRPQHARLLLQAGAHPYGGPWQNHPGERSPITLALEQRNRAMVVLMRPVLARLGLPVPVTPAVLDAGRSRLDRLVLDQTPYGRTLGYLAGTRLELSDEGRVIDCAFTLSVADMAHAPLCDRLRRWLRFRPAENSAGRTVAGSIYLRPFAPEQTDAR